MKKQSINHECIEIIETGSETASDATQVLKLTQNLLNVHVYFFGSSLLFSEQLPTSFLCVCIGFCGENVIEHANEAPIPGRIVSG